MDTDDIEYSGEIDYTEIKPLKDLVVELSNKGNDKKNLKATISITGETFPIKLEGQVGYRKEAYSIEKLIDHLKMKVDLKDDEEEKLKRLIRDKMYYRIAYLVKILYYENNETQKVTYNDLNNIVIFDDFLRTSLGMLLPTVEQFIKSTLNNFLLDASFNDPLAYLNEVFYKTNSKRDKKAYELVCANCALSVRNNISSSPVVKHHVKYHGGEIPIWVLLDTLTFGQFNRLITCLDKQYQNDWFNYIMKYNNHDQPLEVVGKSLISFSQTMQLLRNRVAHNGRIYGVKFVYNPSIKKNNKYWDKIEIDKFGKGKDVQSHSLFTGLVVARFFYSCMSDHEVERWNKFIGDLKYKIVHTKFLNIRGYMGFPDNWEDILKI